MARKSTNATRFEAGEEGAEDKEGDEDEEDEEGEEEGEDVMQSFLSMKSRRLLIPAEIIDMLETLQVPAKSGIFDREHVSSQCAGVGRTGPDQEAGAPGLKEPRTLKAETRRATQAKTGRENRA